MQTDLYNCYTHTQTLIYPALVAYINHKNIFTIADNTKLCKPLSVQSEFTQETPSQNKQQKNIKLCR